MGSVARNISWKAALSSPRRTGDHNFHREAENRSIPDGWGEIPAVVDLGATWSLSTNSMIAHYLPRRNLYNGFGMGGWFAWDTEMRLDRVLVHGNVLATNASHAR